MAAHSGSGFDLTPPSPEQRKLLEADLTAEEANVLLRHATEAPFCGAFLDEKRPGVFTCRLCGLPLFLGGQKFESGTGWPSFTAPFDDDHLREERDSSYGMARTELLCARCGSHQGHVFPDGPPPTGAANMAASRPMASPRQRTSCSRSPLVNVARQRAWGPSPSIRAAS
jgi:peptide-methionine (R)-S-oxide reductase